MRFIGPGVGGDHLGMILTGIIEEKSSLGVLPPVGQGDVDSVPVGQGARKKNEDARIGPLEGKIFPCRPTGGVPGVYRYPLKMLIATSAVVATDTAANRMINPRCILDAVMPSRPCVAGRPTCPPSTQSRR